MKKTIMCAYLFALGSLTSFAGSNPCADHSKNPSNPCAGNPCAGNPCAGSKHIVLASSSDDHTGPQRNAPLDHSRRVMDGGNDHKGPKANAPLLVTCSGNMSDHQDVSTQQNILA